jgi:uncharacterized protein GlcG (DUF336 family)
MVAAAEAEAERNHWRGVVAVVDEGGWVILLERVDHAAMTASVEMAAGKARSAALFKKPTQALEEAINHGRELIRTGMRCASLVQFSVGSFDFFLVSPVRWLVPEQQTFRYSR